MSTTLLNRNIQKEKQKGTRSIRAALKREEAEESGVSDTRQKFKRADLQPVDGQAREGGARRAHNSNRWKAPDFFFSFSPVRHDRKQTGGEDKRYKGSGEGVPFPPRRSHALVSTRDADELFAEAVGKYSARGKQRDIAVSIIGTTRPPRHRRRRRRWDARGRNRPPSARRKCLHAFLP